MKFDVILTNPPFQDTKNRKKTPHKLWIDFTLTIFDRLLTDGGSLVQVSPASFASPSNSVLKLMCTFQTHMLRLNTGIHFPDVASTFSDYWIEKTPNDTRPTIVEVQDSRFTIELDDRISYLPNDLSEIALSIHDKVMFAAGPRLNVEWDYVTAHNIKRHALQPTLTEQQQVGFDYPVFHTNRSIWWSSVKQPWSSERKVMWTRSGYTKPFYDDGVMGGTDMVYFIRVQSPEEGAALAHNLNSAVLRYIYKTAKWSGFGNERVFAGLPAVPMDRLLTDKEMFEFFKLTTAEVTYVERSLAPNRRKAE